MIEINNILDLEKEIEDIDAVIFDLDDTLYQEVDYVKSGFKSIAEYFDMSELESKLWDSFEIGKQAIDDVFTKEDMLEKKDIALQIYRNHKPQITLFPGVKEMLKRIKTSHKKLGLITDGRPGGQRAKILALGIEIYFDKIIITDELGGLSFRKPNPEAFVIMQRVLDVPFERMVYIGDNIKKDFIAPRKLGMKQIFFLNEKGLYKSDK